MRVIRQKYKFSAVITKYSRANVFLGWVTWLEHILKISCPLILQEGYTCIMHRVFRCLAFLMCPQRKWHYKLLSTFT